MFIGFIKVSKDDVLKPPISIKRRGIKLGVFVHNFNAIGRYRVLDDDVDLFSASSCKVISKVACVYVVNIFNFMDDFHDVMIQQID